MTDEQRAARAQAAHDALQEQVGWSGRRDDVLARVALILAAADRAVPVIAAPGHSVVAQVRLLADAVRDDINDVGPYGNGWRGALTRLDAELDRRFGPEPTGEQHG